MLGVRHEPLNPAGRGIVICPSIYMDRIRTYRAEVSLARSLAARGVTVMRFDYRGFGHSDGETADVTYGRMVEDAVAAGDVLRKSGDIDTMAFLGIRIGALVAASVAAKLDDAPLVFWDPILRGKDYFTEAFRALAISRISEGGEVRGTHRSPTTQILERGMVDLLGLPMYRNLYESIEARQLGGELQGRGRSILWVYSGGPIRGTEPPLIAQLRVAGHDVTGVRASLRKNAWWFIGDTGNPFPEAYFIESTLPWLKKQFFETGP